MFANRGSQAAFNNRLRTVGFLTAALAILIAASGTIYSGVAAQPKSSKIILDFPKNVSVGRIVVLDKNWSLLDKHLSGRPFCQCRGRVEVPADQPLMMVANDVLTENASCLDHIPPGALVGMVLVGTTMGDAEIAHLSGLKGLKYLDVEGTDMSDKGLAALKQLQNLGFLNVSRTDFKGEELGSLSCLNNLRFLDMECNAITPKGFKSMTQLKLSKLTFCGFSRTQMHDADLAYINGFKNVSVLEIADNSGITDAALAQLKDFKNLQDIDLRETHITIKGLNVLKGLNLKVVNIPRSAVNVVEARKIISVFPGLKINFDKRERRIEPGVFDPLH